MNKKNNSIFADKAIMNRALKDSVKKLNPKVQIKNPVMFMVFVSAILTLILFVFALFGIRDAQPGFILAVSIILWFTVLFGNFAEAIAEGSASNLSCTDNDWRAVISNWHCWYEPLESGKCSGYERARN